MTIGRRGQFRVGADDQYLHRLLLVVSYQGAWNVHNIGSRMTVNITPNADDNFSSHDLGPDGRYLMPQGESYISFETHNAEYRRAVRVVNGPYTPAVIFDTDDFDGDETKNPFEPNEEQLLLLNLLAEPFFY